SVCGIRSSTARRRSLQYRWQPAQQLFDARSHRNVRTDQRQKDKLELRGNESHWRPHLVDQRRAKVPGALSKLEISIRNARYSRRNLRCGCAKRVIRESRFVNRTIHDVTM